MKIWVYTLCYNEMKILPYIAKYWERYADKVIVYDNGSNDGSQEFLQTLSFVELRHFESDGFNDLINKNIKNNAWKEARERDVDFVQVCDLDEVLYSPIDIKAVCQAMKDKNVDVWRSHWIEVVGENLPTNINEDLYHRSEGFYGVDKANNIFGMQKMKFCLFNPKTIEESNFSEGCHKADFKKFNNENPLIANVTGNKMVVLHFDKLGFDYLKYKYSKNKARLSEINIKHGWGGHYLFNDEQIKLELNNLLQNKQNISEL